MHNYFCQNRKCEKKLQCDRIKSGTNQGSVCICADGTEMMESPASTVRRRAWINSSRQWLTVEDADTQPCSPPFTSIADDDVFSDGLANSPGCCTGKIENWLLSCGSVSSEKADQLSFDSVLKTRNTDDELRLGADAVAINTHGAGFAQHPSTRERRNRLTSGRVRRELCLPSQSLGHSMGSSCFSSSTWNSTASVAEVLQVYSENAEETLYELGFGCEEPQVTVRIPPRFFTFPSQAKGINFRLFLDAQLRRIHEEDPSLSLASRFRQVQVLTAMANAFYSLYSHVSRTPVQKLPTPEFTFSTPIERIERFRSSIRSDPRSPVDKLKDTVSKMCLYTGSPRESDSVSPQPSPKKRASLPDIVDIALENNKPRHIKKIDLGFVDVNTLSDVCLDDYERFSADRIELQLHPVVENQNRNTKKDIVYCEQADVFQLGGLDNETHSERTLVPSLLSEKEVIEADSYTSEAGSRQADPKPLVKTSYELVCPQIVESVHQAPFCSQYKYLQNTNTASEETENTNVSSCLKSHTSLSGISSSDADAHGSCPSPFVPLTKTCSISNADNNQYLSPVQHISSNLQQVNSFELEEVHSAGEEDIGQSGTRKTVLPKSTKHYFTGEVIRGDSMQSDSSGYADEDIPSDRHS